MSPDPTDIHIAVVAASPREGSQSGRVSQVCGRALERSGVRATVIDLARLSLPQAGVEDPASVTGDWPGVAASLHACDGLVFVVPEWGGMAPPAAKNLLLLCDDRQLAHKPLLLVGVSAGQGGVYPLAELRMASFKNTFALWMPVQVLLRSVGQALANDLAPAADAQERRLSEGLAALVEYARALRPARQHLIEASSFDFGV